MSDADAADALMMMLFDDELTPMTPSRRAEAAAAEPLPPIIAPAAAPRYAASDAER